MAIKHTYPNNSNCCKIIVKESREGGGRENYIIDILKDYHT